MTKGRLDNSMEKEKEGLGYAVANELPGIVALHQDPRPIRTNVSPIKNCFLIIFIDF